MSERPLVLVVEDNQDDWRIYGELLWYNGYDVVHAVDGDEGLRLARSRKPDLLLLDLMLPKMDGLEVCRRLREEPGLANTPVVVLSARSAVDVEAEALAAGCTCYYQKPIDPMDVLHRVEALVGRAPPAGEGRLPFKELPGVT